MSSAFFVCTGSENLKDICYKLARISKKSVLRVSSRVVVAFYTVKHCDKKYYFFFLPYLLFLLVFIIFNLNNRVGRISFFLLSRLNLFFNSFLNKELRMEEKRKKNVSAMHIESSSVVSQSSRVSRADRYQLDFKLNGQVDSSQVD